MVYDDAMRFYKDVDETATRLHTQALEILTKSLVATPLLSNKPSTPGLLMVNHTSWPLPPSVIEVEADDKHASKYKQMSADGKKAIVLVESIPAMSMKQITFENRPLDFVPVTGKITTTFFILRVNSLSFFN